MKKKLLNGRGGIVKCPSCGSYNIDAYDRDYIDYDKMVQRIQCYDCNKYFSEMWKATNWEEER